MKYYTIRSCVKPLRGSFFLPGDKSISHRALIVSALSATPTRIVNIADNQDCRATICALRAFGIGVRVKKNPSYAGSLDVIVRGAGRLGFRQPEKAVCTGDSGTTLRLFLGLVAPQSLKVTFVTGKSLAQRPMMRVTRPLRLMGADIKAERRKVGGRKEEFPPLAVKGGKLKGIRYSPRVASAQVKSAILLAGLNACGKTTVIEKIKTRDHTERMLELYRADIVRRGQSITIKGGRELVSPGRFTVPGDISSAAFFLVLACVIPGSNITIKDVSLNPSRMGALKVLRRMGAQITIRGISRATEPRADITVKAGSLKATRVTKEEIPSLIDEIPVLMVAACFARGTTVFAGVSELRVKETDRIVSMKSNLACMGACIETVREAGAEVIRIKGANALTGSSVKSYNDHRTAMSMIVAGLAAAGTTTLDDISCIDKSFPGFTRHIKRLSGSS